MGQGRFHRIPLTHSARGVYTIEIPAEATRNAHLEYYVKVKAGLSKTLYFPATAPKMNQTLIVLN